MFRTFAGFVHELACAWQVPNVHMGLITHIRQQFASRVLVHIDNRGSTLRPRPWYLLSLDVNEVHSRNDRRRGNGVSCTKWLFTASSYRIGLPGRYRVPFRLHVDFSQHPGGLLQRRSRTSHLRDPWEYPCSLLRDAYRRGYRDDIIEFLLAINLFGCIAGPSWHSNAADLRYAGVLRNTP